MVVWDTLFSSMPKSWHVCSTKASVSRNEFSSRSSDNRSLAVNFPFSQYKPPTVNVSYLVVLGVDALLTSAET